jgi:hypothetical protein
MTQRRCAEPDCGTILSRYNPDERCALHALHPDVEAWNDAWEFVSYGRDEPWIKGHLPLWSHFGNCASGGPGFALGQLTEDFFAEETSAGLATAQVRDPKARCHGCPVQLLCLRWAFTHETAKYRAGIYGGLTPTERDAVSADPDPVAAGLALFDEQVTMGLVRPPSRKEYVDVVSVRRARVTR